MILVCTTLTLWVITAEIFWNLYSEAVKEEVGHLEALVSFQSKIYEELSSKAILEFVQSSPRKMLNGKSTSLFVNNRYSFREGGQLSFVDRLPSWIEENPLLGPSTLSGSFPTTKDPGSVSTKQPSKGLTDFIGSDPQGRERLVVYTAIPGIPFWVLATQELTYIRSPFVKGAILACLFQGSVLFIGWGVLKRFKVSTDQALQERERKIRAVVASAGEGIITFDEFSLIESFNEKAEQMFGYGEQEVLGKHFHILVGIDDYENLKKFLKTYQPSGITRSTGSTTELMGKRKDGSLFFMVLILTEAPIWGHRLFTALIQDVTQRKLAERRLAAQYSVAQVLTRCTSIQEATPEILRAICEGLGWQLGILWQVDSAESRLQCVEVWRSSLDRFGEFVKTTQGMTFPEGVGLPGRIWEKGNAIWIPDSVKDKNFPRAPLADKEGLHAAFGFPIRLGNATLGVMEFFSREIEEPDRDLLHQMLVLGSQIGQFMQRIETETTLREKEEQTRLILDAALDAVIALDEHGRIMQWNAQAERVFGWTKEEVFGQTLTETIVPPQFREAHQRGIERYVKSGESHILNTRFEMMGLRCDGQEIPLELAITAVRSKGKVIFNGFLRDLTERRQADAALLKSEEQLRQAQKMEAIGTLAGGIAHDFNNILSAIIGYTELAMAQIGLGSSILPKLQEVLRAGYRAKNLVRQILTFSRQDVSGKKVIYLQPIVEEALALLRASLPSTILLTYELQSSLRPVLADATQIHQVIMNLGANAEYAMRETGGTLRVMLDEVYMEDSSALATHQSLVPGHFIRLQVTDSGLGMAPDIKKRIFDPFFTTKEVGEGTGMGLAVIHGIVKGHGGAIQVESRVGVGSNFVLYFPCSDKPAGDHSPSDSSKICNGAGRLMFVDDEVSLTRWAKDMLEEVGYQVVVHTNGQDAIEDFQRHSKNFDALITDQTMPGMTGEQLTKRVLEIRPDFPVILCTGFSYTIDEGKARSMGIRAYLIKPVLMADLVQTLRATLKPPGSLEGSH